MKAKISAQQLMEKQVSLQASANAMDSEARHIEIYKKQVEMLLTSTAHTVVPSFYNGELADILSARHRALDMADNAWEDMKDNINFFEQAKKDAQEKAKEISEELKILDKQLSDIQSGKRHRQIISLDAKNKLVKAQINLKKELDEQLETMAAWNTKLQELEIQKSKVKGIRKILKQSANNKFTFNRPQGFLSWILGH